MNGCYEKGTSYNLTYRNISLSIYAYITPNASAMHYVLMKCVICTTVYVPVCVYFTLCVCMCLCLSVNTALYLQAHDYRSLYVHLYLYSFTSVHIYLHVCSHLCSYIYLFSLCP